MICKAKGVSVGEASLGNRASRAGQLHLEFEVTEIAMPGEGASQGSSGKPGGTFQFILAATTNPRCIQSEIITRQQNILPVTERVTA